MSGAKIWKSLVTGYVMEMVLIGGSEEPLGSVKTCQGSRGEDVMIKSILHFDREYFGKNRVH
jgi:hypothetical protein